MGITTRQKQILVGSILGDGGLYCSTSSSNAHYYVKQSEKHSEYVKWLFDELKDICPSVIKQRKDNKQFYFYSSPSKNLTKLQKSFYKDRIKRVPSNIKELLVSPLSLAVWFMDDGTLDYREKDHCAFHLCTNCFTKKDVERLAKTLKSNFGIMASVHYTLCRGKRHARLYVGARGRDRFIKLVTPYILDCFKYKLPKYRMNLQRLAELSSTDSKR